MIGMPFSLARIRFIGPAAVEGHDRVQPPEHYQLGLQDVELVLTWRPDPSLGRWLLFHISRPSTQRSGSIHPLAE